MSSPSDQYTNPSTTQRFRRDALRLSTFKEAEEDSQQFSQADTRRSASPPVSRGKKLPTLITLDGRRVSDRFVLTKRRSLVGRDVTADIVVHDGEVSRLHCMVEWVNFDGAGDSLPQCFVRDLGSTNGTFYNGYRVAGSVYLEDGGQLRIGSTVLGFFLKDERVLELDRMLMAMALHDSLTQVFKREYFLSQLNREMDRARRHGRSLSLLMLDLDFFKKINDDFGHLVGDDVLRQFTTLVKKCLRDSDTCGRFGGEEFTVALPETDMEGAIQAAERIRGLVGEHAFQVGEGEERRMTVSIGVSTMGLHHRDPMMLVDEADKALYKAKSRGRNRVEPWILDVDADSETGKIIAFGSK